MNRSPKRMIFPPNAKITQKNDDNLSSATLKCVRNHNPPFRGRQ